MVKYVGDAVVRGPVGGVQEQDTIQYLAIRKNVFNVAGVENVLAVGGVDLNQLNLNVENKHIQGDWQ